mmetsp:Transcript_29174/g.34380  ORF Transcript_29174/g.34380 Transcript_29174/m.34380 type:complete len:297 (-) Transcript_29174:13-903(-)|eukprot:CAMPEP_0114351758 /NCGR_PEP_ID=MMETSP0101-20121206/17438_1 /TAXON_ID=38822 ORGANISM="Pteridomonas danica, Strain PT" /NCGR_SAMPLE_ID=MMETSP0101 /ASSEMBLY_ACC=CAM_ASM_000211 /LENGTH=296 /DNA_ID=CAMNT_0001491823 /DNA_START=27 /DNA_END=917 /DNA_ORIENTATION=+
MSSGDVFRSYHACGDGRDLHLFISSKNIIPQTAKTFDAYKQPMYKPTSFDRPSTIPPARFVADGSGRDGFQGNRTPPATGKQFSPYVSPGNALPPMPSKGYNYSVGVRAGYAPNGSGRDLQMFVATGDAIPATGFQYSSAPPSIKRSQQPVPACRTDPPNRTQPSGSGRDLFQVGTIGRGGIPATAITFSEFSPSPKGPLPAARTSPPPRYVPSGSGRDGFQRVVISGPENNSKDAFGFGPPRWDPAARHRPKTSHAAQQKQASHNLSRPRTGGPRTGEIRPVSTGLLVPGTNLRK